MNKITVLTLDWKRWLDENVQRGCSPASMVAAMREAGVDPDVAVQWAREAYTPSAAAAQAPPAVAGSPPAAYVCDVVRLPDTGNRIDAGDRDVRLALRMARPVLAVFDGLLSGAECDELIRLSGVKLNRSTIVDPQSGEQLPIDNRSSDGTYFLVGETEFIGRIDRRISALLRWPVENGEGLQILRYGVGGQYTPHFDYFEPSHPGSAAHLARGGQRVSTLIIYLNDVEQGGETVFPDLGLRVVPRKGSAVYFEYCNSLGHVDPRTLHGGAPVAAGEKWIATRWMRQRRYG